MHPIYSYRRKNLLEYIESGHLGLRLKSSQGFKKFCNSDDFYKIKEGDNALKKQVKDSFTLVNMKTDAKDTLKNFQIVL